MEHPEIKKNEFLLSNVKRGEEWKFGFISGEDIVDGRLGEIAYNQMGDVLPDYRPVFAQRWWPAIVKGKLIRIYTELNQIHPHDLNLLSKKEVIALNKELAEQVVLTPGICGDFDIRLLQPDYPE